MPNAEPSPEEFSLFVHLSEHLLVQKGGSHPPVLLLPDCWFWATGGAVPDWADTLAGSNVPGWAWCPWLKPALLDLTEAEQQAWVEGWLARA